MSGSNSEESVAPSIHPGGEYVGDVVMLSLFVALFQTTKKIDFLLPGVAHCHHCCHRVPKHINGFLILDFLNSTFKRSNEQLTGSGGKMTCLT